MLPEVFQLKIKSHRQILDTIRIHGEISAAELARLNNLQPSTLVYILRSLKSKGLIEVSRISAQLGSAGKPPTLWRLVANKGYIIGLEIIPNEMRATVIDFSGKIIHQEHQVELDNIGPDKLLDSIQKFFEEVITHLKLSKNDILGIGVGLTGLVDREKGLVHFSRKLALNNFPIESELRKLLKCQVEVVNDANAGALGIKWQVGNSAPVKSNVIFLTLNEKIGFFGAGLILNEVLYEGANGTAGEIYTSLPILSELFEKAIEQKGEDLPLVQLYHKEKKIDIDDVIDCARQGCDVSHIIIQRYKTFIVEEIVRLVQLLNPDVFVLGGDITDAEDLIYKDIVHDIRERLAEIFPSGVQMPEILFSAFGIYSVSVGATALILRRIFM